jgi:hypothetical protein
MNSTYLPVNRSSKSTARECSPAYLSERLFERSITFAEIADLAEKCDLWEVDGASAESRKPPITFTVPTIQLFASISRVVE